MTTYQQSFEYGAVALKLTHEEVESSQVFRSLLAVARDYLDWPKPLRWSA